MKDVRIKIAKKYPPRFRKIFELAQTLVRSDTHSINFEKSKVFCTKNADVRI